MNKQINFQITDKTQLTERIVDYFVKSKFKFVEINKDKLKFIHRSSFFDTWTTNPLEWGSEIIISLNDNELTAVFCVNTQGQMNSIEEENVWNGFIYNFRTFINEKSDFNMVYKKNTATVKKSRLIYVGWTILGVVVGGIMGIFLSNFTGSKLIGYFIMPAMATLFLNKSLQYRREKCRVTLLV